MRGFPTLDRRTFSTAICGAVFCLAAAFAVYAHCQADVWPEDDAFITYRYVQHLSAGQGLVYNDGQRVFGSSTPLYLLWLAAAHWLLGVTDLPALAVRGNLVLFLAVGVGVVCLLRATVGSAALAFLSGALLLSSPLLLERSVDGMEGMLQAALIVWTLWALATERIGIAALLAGLSPLARPEGVFCIALVALYAALHHRRAWRTLAAPLLVPSALWAAFATVYYGSPVPHSLIAKSRPLYPVPPGDALYRLSGRIGRWAATPGVQGREGQLAAAVALIAIAVGGARLARRWRPKDWWIVPALLGTLVVFYALTNPLMFEWYYGPIWVVWFLTLVAGWAQAGSWLDRRSATRGSSRRPVMQRLGAAVILLLVGAAAVGPYRDLLQSHSLAGFLGTAIDYRLRIAGYRDAAFWLNANAPAQARVAAAEVGALGYFSHAYILDACGLVTPEALPFQPGPAEERLSPAHGVISTDFVKATDPDFVVTLWVFGARSLLPSPWFAEHYELAAQVPLPAPLWDSPDVLIFARRR